MTVCNLCQHANPPSALICEQCNAILLGGPGASPEPTRRSEEVFSGIVDLKEVEARSPAAEPPSLDASDLGEIPSGVPTGVPVGRPVSGVHDVTQAEPDPAPKKPSLTLKAPSRKLQQEVRERAATLEAGAGIPADLLGPLPGSTAPPPRPPAMSAVRTITLNDRIAMFTPSQRIEAGDKALAAHEPAEALAWFEAALQDDMTNVALLERMVETARAANDPVRLSRCLATLAQLAPDAATRAEYLVQAATVTRDGRRQPDKAAAGFTAALEQDPDRLDAFLALTEIHTASQDWPALGEAYRLMISLHSRRAEPNRKLLAKLWRKLGSLLADQLGFYDDAVTAVRTAIMVDPNDTKNPFTLYEIARRQGDLETAVAAMSDVIRLEDDAAREVDDLRTLGELYLEMGKRDAGYCCFRAVDYHHEATEREATFVARLRPRGVRTPSHELTPALWNLVYPADFPHDIGQILSLLALAVGSRLTNEPHAFGVGAKDRLDPGEPLLFNRLLQGVGRLYGIGRTPNVFVKSDLGHEAGMVNGLFDPPGFVVDRSLLSGQQPADVAFVVGRLMALQKSSFFLAGNCAINDLQVYVMGATKFVRPDAPVPMSKDIEWILERLQSRLDATQQAQLRERLGGLIERSAVIDVAGYLDAVDTTANRLAFLVADDLAAAERFMLAEREPITAAAVDDRLHRLVDFSVSPPYLELRAALGMQVQQAAQAGT